MYKERIAALRLLIEENRLDSMLVSSQSNVYYLCGFRGLSPTDREAFVFITRQHAYIITNALYVNEIKNKDFSIEEVSGDNSLTKILERITTEEKLSRIGFEETNITVAEFNRISKLPAKLLPASPTKLRTQKNSNEIAFVSVACEIGDKIFQKILPSITPGVTELEIASRMEILMKEAHANPSFPTIVAFGQNAAVPHHVTGKTKLAKNQFVLLDFGVLYNNYCSDMSRTVFVGSPTKDDLHAYETVKIAQQHAIETLEAMHADGQLIPASQIDKVARSYILSQGFEEFPHSLGHGIGIDVHESPSLSPYSKDILAEGMIFSIEPGIYQVGKRGVRIEDLFAIETNIVNRLTHSPVDLIVL